MFEFIGLTQYRCQICHQQAEWLEESITHADKCPVPIIEEIENEKQNL